MLVKKFTHLALAAAMLASSAVGAATLAPTDAVAMEQPWMIITYLRDGKQVGSTQVFCNSPDINFGDTTNYHTTHVQYYFMCP